MCLKGNRLCQICSEMAVFLICGLCPVSGSGWKTLRGHVPALISYFTLSRKSGLPVVKRGSTAQRVLATQIGLPGVRFHAKLIP